MCAQTVTCLIGEFSQFYGAVTYLVWKLVTSEGTILLLTRDDGPGDGRCKQVQTQVWTPSVSIERAPSGVRGRDV